MQFKKNPRYQGSDDPFYDLCNGYIKPENVLEDQADIDKVNAAVKILETFICELEDFEDAGIVEYF